MTQDSLKKWDDRFLKLAVHIAGWSKDPSTKVGAVIADDKQRLVSVGYNGFPRGVHDDEWRLQDKQMKYQLVVHAEVNAVLFAGRPLHDCTMYLTMLSCSTCTGVIINSGIRRVVAFNYFPDRWKESLMLSIKMYQEAGVEINLMELV